jgi:Ca2+-dependent lipid-binding protein
VIRLYIIDCYELAKRDLYSESDPYLVIKINEITINERDNYQNNEPNPGFYCHYDFGVVFPGWTPLKIQLWDYDTIFGDDFIGETIIDVEDRYFSSEWQSIKDKPIEYRQLSHPSSQASQGGIRLWLEIHPIDYQETTVQPWNITPKPPQEFEIRVAIWDTDDIDAYDWEGVSDVYVKAYIDSTKSAAETDTHWLMKEGKASFNYRLIFNVKTPGCQGKLNIQLWDRDIFSPNDFIGGCTLNISKILSDVEELKKPVNFNEKYANSIDLQEYKEFEFIERDKISVKCSDREGKYIGKIRIQIGVYPIEFAQENPVGKGRNSPNHSPYLPPPTGRMEWSLNPFKMLNQMFSAEVRNKILCAIWVLIMIIIFIVFLPSIVGALIGSLIS